MNILLLGATGQLGSDIQCLASEETGRFNITPWSRATLDVARIDAIPDALADRDFDVLINCASFHATDAVETDAQRAFTVNAHAVQAMADACRRKGARFVHISTDYVFDGCRRSPYGEDDAPGPLNVYGASKLMGEALARVAHQDAIIFRVASLFGVAGSRGKGGNFVETMIRVGREKGTLRVIDDQFMSPTSTADVAGAILVALEAGIAPGVYHAVNTGQASWYEFARRIIERAGVDATVEPIPAAEYPLPARRPAYSVLANAKLAAVAGPIPHWTDGLDRYLHAKGYAQKKSPANAGHEAAVT